MDQRVSDSILVLISGGHASGKSSGARILVNQLSELDDQLHVKEVNMNDYFREDPNMPGCREPLLYDFQRLENDLNIYMNQDFDVVILYGLYALYDKDIVSQATVKVFIDCDADVRLGRWIERDVLNRKRDLNLDEVVLQQKQKEELESLLSTYLQYSRNEMKLYINDTKDKADIILPRGADLVGFTLILDGLKPLLLEKIQQHRTMSNSDFSEYGTLPIIHSTANFNRETVLHTLKQISDEPSVQSLTNDNFSNTRKIFYDAN